MTEVIYPKSDVDEFTLGVEDWDIACQIHPNYHDAVGTGAAEWAMWWKWEHEHAKPFQYACAGCYKTLIHHPSLVIRCRKCFVMLPGPMRQYIVRTERIKP